MAHLNSSQPIFLVDFYGESEHFIFDYEPETLGNLVKLHGKNGVVSIKQYQPYKGNFKKLSAKEVSNYWSWDTHTIEQLKKINYIKK